MSAGIPGEFVVHLAPFFTEGAAMGPNLLAALREASYLSSEAFVIDNTVPDSQRPPCGHHYVATGDAPTCSPAEEAEKYGAARQYLAASIASREFLLPDDQLSLQLSPYSDAGVLARILHILGSVADSPEAEQARLGQEVYLKAFERKSKELARLAARAKLDITGWDPRPGQPRAEEFQREVALAIASEKVRQETEAHAVHARDTFTTDEMPKLPLEATVQLLRLARRRFGDHEKLARVVFAQVQEVTHASAACVRFDGVDVPYGRSGLVRATPDSTRCPSKHHVSRSAPYNLIRRMWREGECQRHLGLVGSAQVPFMCGLPPFFAGDTTAGEDYCLGGSKVQAAFLGDQSHDCGFHVSWYNRRDAISIATSNDCYQTPSLPVLRGLVERSLRGDSFHLEGVGAVGPLLEVRITTAELKLVQGQKRNGPAVGGHAYISWAQPARGMAVTTAARNTILPGAPPDASFSPHFSAAILGPRLLPHLKSPHCVEVARSLQRQGCNMEAVWTAFANAHELLRAKTSPAELGWDLYEEAAALMGQHKTSHVLLEVLGFKAIVCSPALGLEDHLPTTPYCGPCAPASLRALGNDTTPLKSPGGLATFDISGTAGDALSHCMTAATYRKLCATEEEQAAAESAVEKAMTDVGAAAMLLPMGAP